MAHLSAHTEETSDAVYGGEEGTLLNFTQNDLDRFRSSTAASALYCSDNSHRLCAKLFNDFVGITTSETEARAGLASIKSPALCPPPADADDFVGITSPRSLVTCPSATFTPPRPNRQTPPTAPKVKHRADEQETEEHGSSAAYDDRVHRVPKQGLAVAPQTGPFRVDAASSSNHVVCSKGGSNDLTALDILWDELSSKDISTDVKSQKRLRPTTPTSHVLPPSTRQPLPSRPGPPYPGKTLALPTVPHTPLPRASIAGPAADGAPLVTVTDFAFQAEVIRLLTHANRKEGDCNTISNSCGRSTPNTCHRRELAGHSANIQR